MLIVLENVTVAGYEPGLMELAAAVKQTLTVFESPGARLPPAGSTLTHGWLAVAVQPRALLPLFLARYAWQEGLNGPPIWPELLRPVPGLTRRSSGTSNDSWMPVVVELAGDVVFELTVEVIPEG